MSGRIRAIGTGLLVGATSVTVVGAAAAAAGVARSQPASSAVRTTVRSTSAAMRPEPSAAPVSAAAMEAGVKAHNDRVQIQHLTEELDARRTLEAAIADAERERVLVAAAARARRSSSSTTSSGRTGNVLDCIRHRESRGQYGVVNGSSGAAGAYQFMPGTWNNTARSAGRSDLVGVNPASASAADQDAMARHLLSTQGLGPWGGGCG
jgi:hypothetical protein